MAEQGAGASPAGDVHELWAWVVLGPADRGGDMATVTGPDGTVVPLVSRNEQTMRDVRDLVVRVVRQTGETVVLQRFALAAVEDVVTPTLLEAP